MKKLNETAEKLNIMGDYLSRRDVLSLTKEEIKNKYGIEKADVLILFGGCIIHGWDIAANAVKAGLAKHFLVSGGIGHTTSELWNTISEKFPDINTENRPEADIITDYLKLKYNLENILIENKSTNCGNNVTFALETLKKNSISAKNIIIIQDSTMQQRMDATFKKFITDTNVNIINYAPYIARVKAGKYGLEFEPPHITGMWNMEKYINLLMGEIPRLSDNKNGYGPKGKNLIASVNIPGNVLDAFDYLYKDYSSYVRTADERFKS
jgi:uncharacterized SAM-binding protein YcdF (DUF218 family)